GATAVVYVDSGGPHTRDLWVVERQPGGGWSAPRLLTGLSPFSLNYWPVLAPDGSKVLFDASTADGGFPSTRICEVRLNGSGFRVVVSKDDGPSGTTSPAVHSGAYAPDGSVVFEAEWGGGEQVWRRTGSGVPALVGGFPNDNSPNVLPDGRILSLWLN